LCAFVADHYDGDAGGLWEGVDSGAELLARLRELPGYGQEKARIFVAILAKRRGVRPDGWEAAAGPFADPAPRSVADIDGPESLAKVREWKKAQKAAKKDKQDRPLAP
ncbi:MAG TPA: Fe-S cluster assembly protein HesB, partial [Acidimicrobiales bacterium]|nr:Fe-S cluster assembly protein HesB [Acidimicrobiales bacterium]